MSEPVWPRVKPLSGRPKKRSGRRKVSVGIEHDCEQAAQAYASAGGKSLSDVVNEALSVFFSVGEKKKNK